MTTLGHIVKNQLILLSEIEANGGELTEEMEKSLSLADCALSSKVDNYAMLIDRLEKEIEYHDKLADDFYKRASTYQALRDRLRENMKYQMNVLGLNKVQGEYHSFTVSKSTPRVVIKDESLIPEQFKETVTEIKLKTKELREALKENPIQGAELEETYSLRQGVARRLAIE